MDANRYAPPTAAVEGPVAHEASPPLWNPNGAANWCLLFTPIFGAWLHMKNWQALGEPARARSARLWVIVSAVVIFGSATAGALNPLGPMLGIGKIGAFVLLLAWYFASAKPQAKLVQSRFGNDYPRRSWGVPMFLAVVGFVSYVMAIRLITFLATGQ